MLPRTVGHSSFAFYKQGAALRLEDATIQLLIFYHHVVFEQMQAAEQRPICSPGWSEAEPRGGNVAR